MLYNEAEKAKGTNFDASFYLKKEDDTVRLSIGNLLLKKERRTTNEEKIPNHCGGTGPLPERSVQPGGFGGRLWHCCSNAACRSSADHLDKPENRTAGLDTDPWREEVSQQVLLQWHERPGKGVSFDRKTERFHGLQKVLRLNREGSFRLEGAFLCIIAFYRAPPRRSGPRERAGFHGIPSLRWNKWQSSYKSNDTSFNIDCLPTWQSSPDWQTTYFASRTQVCHLGKVRFTVLVR